MVFLQSIQSEWIKRRHSSASWLTLFGALFIPAIVLVRRILSPERLLASNSSDKVWDSLYTQNWQYMSIFVLPIGIILTASLLAQIEFRNNSWKQLHTTPQSLTTIFISKFSIAITMLIQFFLLFNLGIFLSGVIPAFIFRDVPFPKQNFPFYKFVIGNAQFFLYCLPILSLQYLLSIQVRNFMVPIGVGFGLVTASLIAVSWKYGYLLPYTYCTKQFLLNDDRIDPTINMKAWAVGYFVLFTVLNYILYTKRSNRG